MTVALVSYPQVDKGGEEDDEKAKGVKEGLNAPHGEQMEWEQGKEREKESATIQAILKQDSKVSAKIMSIFGNRVSLYSFLATSFPNCNHPYRISHATCASSLPCSPQPQQIPVPKLLVLVLCLVILTALSIFRGARTGGYYDLSLGPFPCVGSENNGKHPCLCLCSTSFLAETSHTPVLRRQHDWSGGLWGCLLGLVDPHLCLAGPHRGLHCTLPSQGLPPSCGVWLPFPQVRHSMDEAECDFPAILLLYRGNWCRFVCA